jgi:hypothetical protein
MLLGILSVIALSVGTIQTATDLNQAERLALEESQIAMVQVVDQPGLPESSYDSLGL